jgi:hypothetical protein
MPKSNTPSLGQGDKAFKIREEEAFYLKHERPYG